MQVLIKNLKPGTKIAVLWQSHIDGGYTHPIGRLIHHEGKEHFISRGLPQTFGYYVVRTSLDGYKTFEEAYPVTEEVTEIKVSYRKIK